LLAVLRGASGPVPSSALHAGWPDREQRGRVLAALVGDGLVVRLADGLVGLPGEHGSLAALSRGHASPLGSLAVTARVHSKPG